MNRRKLLVIAVLSLCLVIGGVIMNHAGDQVTQAESVAAATAKAQTSGTDNGAIKTAGEGDAVVTAAEQSAFASMELAAENETLMLHIKRETAEIAVKDKRDGYIWFSNPVGRVDDPIASPLYKSELSSQVLLSYYNEKGQIYSFNSYDDSVKKNQFDMQLMDQGAKVVYRFGHVSANTEIIPAVISKERLEQRILNNLKDEKDRKQVLYKYRFNEEKQVYEVRKLQDNVAAELAGLLASAGYTKEDAAEDNKENGMTSQESEDSAEFTVPVEYMLDGEHLVVSIPAKEVKYTPAFPLASIQVLKYFGAADDKKEGYIFVPDGSGAIIKLNNQKLNAEPYRLPVYGQDGTFDVKERILTNEPTRLPVFGLKQNDHAFLGIMENGEALASVSADIGGRYVSYNNVSGSFRFVAMDLYTLSSGSKTSSVPMFQAKAYQGDIRIRYAFLSGRSADYVGMAGTYRNYLIGKYKLGKLEHAEDSPFVLELEGAFKNRKSFLGIPYSSTESLTSYDEAVKLLTMLKEHGISNVSLRYVGWFNGGIRHDSPGEIDIEGALGGKKGFRRLIDYTALNGISLYPDAAFLKKYKGASGSANFLDRRKAGIYEYDSVTYMRDTTRFSHYVMSASKLPGVVDGFLADYAKLGISGVSLRDMGDEVNSDFDPTTPVNRQEALEAIVKETSKLKKQVGSLMVNGGNAYLLPYASAVINAPTVSSAMNITDGDVPFYQIALHGYVDLAGAPFNMDRYQNPRVSMLKALETGSNIYYQWFYSPSSTVKDTAFNSLYALHYQDWFDEAIKLYQEGNAILKDVRDQTITGHRKLADQVVETTFENGISIFVNYNKTAVQIDGMKVDAESFRVGGEPTK
ncbi:DUF5696 domain-containing protein [Cohnella sp.]|uniref:DUF5696 domain-containing protein n=1 Tax=Cohnella sp. TaxID=1883426 RepID=UPI003566C451